VGFGTEILFVLLLGLLVLGPKRLHAMLTHVARAKAGFEHQETWTCLCCTFSQRHSKGQRVPCSSRYM
jgi:hypothetical protein